MKFYTTFIRKVNDFSVSKRKEKRSKFEMKEPEPTNLKKYKKYMNMMEEGNGTCPRVSELSIRLEQDRLKDKKSKKRLLHIEES